MKVGILTFHRAHNYGAIMQLYALKTYIENLGHEVQVIDYIKERIDRGYPKVRLPKTGTEEEKEILEYGEEAYKRKWEKFNKFIMELDKTEEVHSEEDLEKLDLDYIICGSDQIWNPNYTEGFDPVYFGGKNKIARKISYAASMGIKRANLEDEKTLEDRLSNLDYISVREECLRKYAQKFTNKRVQTVLDPSLLLDAEDYLRIEIKPQYSNYLFVYTMFENENMMKIADKIAKEKGLTVVELTQDGNKPNKEHHIQVSDAGPGEFIGLVNNADFIVTNSFHGTNFALIFNKEFYTIPVELVNSRIENILKVSKAEDRCIMNEEEIDLNLKMNYKKIMANLNVGRSKSYEFLKLALDIEEVVKCS